MGLSLGCFVSMNPKDSWKLRERDGVTVRVGLDIKSIVQRLREPGELARLIRDGFSSAMKGVIRQISSCVKAINSHDQYFDVDRYADQFEPVPPVWVTGENGVGKRHVVETLRSQCRSREYYVEFEVERTDERTVWSELFGAQSRPDEPGGKFWLAEDGFLVVHRPERLPPNVLRPLVTWRRSGMMQREGDWTAPQPIDVISVFISTQQPWQAIVDPAICECLSSGKPWHIHIPPLRNRPKDILLYAQHLLRSQGQIFKGLEFSLAANFDDEASLSWSGTHGRRTFEELSDSWSSSSTEEY
jgi:transcriptional regulator with AAA-type ATPase domain